MGKTGLSTPWVSFARKLHVLFGQDPEITVIYEEIEDAPAVKLYVDNAAKADALATMLPAEKTFGNVTMTITVIPSNKEDAPIDIFRKIFAGNPIFKDIIIDDDQGSFGFSHVMFEKKVVQYFDDVLCDPNNFQSTLYEDIARDVFEDSKGVFFNTDCEGEFEIWP